MSQRRLQRGDTLVEVALALAIIASVMASTTALAASAFRLGQAARQRTEAASIMQQEAELLRNQRDTNLSSTTGWNTFTKNILSPSGLARACGPGNPTYALVPNPQGNYSNWQGIDNTWQLATSNPNGYPTDKFWTVKTSQGSYDTWLEACRIGASASDLRFNIQIRWTAPGGTAESGNVVTELADVSGIQQLALSLDGGGTPPPPPPPPPSAPNTITISNLQVRGSLSGWSGMYDSGQCRSSGCETPVYAWYVTYTGSAPSCSLAGRSVGLFSWGTPFPGGNAQGSSGPGSGTLSCSSPGASASRTVGYYVTYCEPEQVAPWPSAGYGSYSSVSHGGVHFLKCPAP